MGKSNPIQHKAFGKVDRSARAVIFPDQNIARRQAIERRHSTRNLTRDALHAALVNVKSNACVRPLHMNAFACNLITPRFVFLLVGGGKSEIMILCARVGHHQEVREIDCDAITNIRVMRLNEHRRLKVWNFVFGETTKS